MQFPLNEGIALAFHYISYIPFIYKNRPSGSMKSIRKIFSPLLPVLLAYFIVGCTEPGWYSQTPGPSFEFQGDYWVVWDTWLFDARKAIAVGSEGVILQTTNGGTTWIRQQSGTGNPLQGVCFSDSLHGWVVGSSTILHTNDGGSTWTQQASGITANLARVFSIDTSTAWVVCKVEESAIIYHTTDGGITWTPQRTGVRTYLWDIIFNDPDTGIAVGGWCDHCGGGPYYSGYILRTTNGGATWHLQYHDTTMIGFMGVAFADAHSGLVVGARGTIFRTTDGGVSWTRQTSGTTVDLRDVCYAGSDTAYVVGGESFEPYQEGVILRTTDGGITWTKQEIPVKNTLNRVSFTDNKTGMATGMRTILRTNSGGEPVPRKNRNGLAGNLRLIPNYHKAINYQK